jgi:hypothetical protein
MDQTEQTQRQLLRHTLAVIAYRGGKTVAQASAEFATFNAEANDRTPARILAHIGDLFDWALTLVQGQQAWHDSTPLAWEQEVARFYATLQRFDEYLASDAPLQAPVERLLQGPLADALTHVGQLAMLRRLAGAPIKGENYFNADIVAGRLGTDQPRPAIEFD